VNAYPVVLDGSAFSAVVIGGGAVASRKVRGLLEGGVKVTVVAPDVTPDLDALEREGRLACVRRGYTEGDIDSGDLVIVATNDADLNAAIVAHARRCGKLVNAANDAPSGNFMTPAVLRAGDLSIAVSTSGLPSAAAAIRDELAKRFDGRYATAIAALREYRAALLDAGRGDEWRSLAASLRVEFCSQVEAGPQDLKVPTWR
jgi:precorrin-2 dehydrogenase/sirohydrochlorin ferrochelatase